MNNKIDQYQYLNVIVNVDLCTTEPWDIQDKCSQGAYSEQKEWYFFSHKGKKYPTGSRTNRATAAGFWKATGRDKAVLSKNQVICMRKTLVFYQGRAVSPNEPSYTRFLYRTDPHDKLSFIATNSTSPLMPQQQEVDNPSYKYMNAHPYPVELVPEIDVSDYANHLLATEGLSSDWDCLNQPVELQATGEYAV